MGSLRQHPELTTKIERMTAVALAEQLEGPNPPLVLDVRSEKEWSVGHIAGSMNIPLTHLRERIVEIEKDRNVVVHCEGGYRSAIAASLLAQAGLANLHDVVGGYKAWVASKLPTLTEAAIAVGE